MQVEDHAAVLRLLPDRHHDLTALRTQAACRLHVVLRELIAGGAPLRLSADRAARLLGGVRPNTAVEVERKAIAHDLLVDIRRIDRDITAMKTRIEAAVAVSGTTLVELNGVGPIVAALVLGQVGDSRRFPTRDCFAAYNLTAPLDAPLEASSGPRVRHRLNPRGNRQLNHALHLIAVTQIAHDTDAPTTTARSPRGSGRKKHCAHSSGASATPSGDSYALTSTSTEQGGPGRADGTTRVQRGRLCT